MTSTILTDNGLETLKKLEGFRLTPYDDQTGKSITSWVPGATIGYGFLILQSNWVVYKDGITELEATNLLDLTLKTFADRVDNAINVDLSDNEYDALVIFCYNIGRGAFQTSSVVKLINDPKARTSYSSLEAAWKAFNKSQGKVNKGLQNRRNIEWDIFKNNQYL